MEKSPLVISLSQPTADLYTCKHPRANWMAQVLTFTAARHQVSQRWPPLVCADTYHSDKLLLSARQTFEWEHQSARHLSCQMVCQSRAETGHFYASLTHFHRLQSKSAEVNLVTRHLGTFTINWKKMTEEVVTTVRSGRRSKFVRHNCTTWKKDQIADLSLAEQCVCVRVRKRFCISTTDILCTH